MGNNQLLLKGEKSYINSFGILSNQKKMLPFQNIKFKCNPALIDLEKG